MSDTFVNPTLITLKNAQGMEVILMDWGATLISIKVPVDGELKEMLIGPSKAEDYKNQECYMGATIGRYANRINHCSFEANNQSYTIDMGGKDVALHGGKEGFDKRRFTVEKSTSNSVTFSLYSVDQDQGFPGNFKLKVNYHLHDDGALRIDYEAHCDQECPACITNHSYFNLNGYHSKIFKHEAQFRSHRILVVDDKCIPTGEIFDVKAKHAYKADGKVNNFNFTQKKLLAANGVKDFQDDNNMIYTRAYDHCFIIDEDDKVRNGLEPCVCIQGENLFNSDKKVELQVFTNYPAFQFYAGCFINDGTDKIAIARDDNKAYEPYDAFCIEPEFFPDSPHLPQFKHLNPIVSPQEPLKRFIIYKFNVI